MWGKSSRRASKQFFGAQEVVIMTIHRLIQGAAFEPETIALLTQAYESAVALAGENQPPIVLETIAKHIVESAGRGERDPQKMIEFAVRGITPLRDNF
jgi:hypothetical protein